MLAIYLFMPTYLVLADDPKTGQSSSQTEQLASEEVDSWYFKVAD
jgi:hypothetical protein